MFDMGISKKELERLEKLAKIDDEKILRGEKSVRVFPANSFEFMHEDCLKELIEGQED